MFAVLIRKRRPRISTLFPYTTLFRSNVAGLGAYPSPARARVIWAGAGRGTDALVERSEEHTSELQSHSDFLCRLLREKKNKITVTAVAHITRNSILKSDPSEDRRKLL